MLLAYCQEVFMAFDEKIFGARIKELRLASNMTQSDLGEHIGLSKQAINDIEQGRRQTTITKAILLARLFNTTVEYLIGDTDKAERPDNLSFMERFFVNDEIIRFSDRLKSIRVSKNLSPVDIAANTTLKKSQYIKLETAGTLPNLYDLIILADYFNVSIDYLVGRTDNPEINK